MNFLRKYMAISLLVWSGLAFAPQELSAALNAETFEIHVVLVPTYLYANTAYDVPVRIHIVGLGPSVHVDPAALLITYTADGQKFAFPAPPFAKLDGFFEQGNDTSDTYTCWLPREQFNAMVIDKPVTDTSVFQAFGNFTRVTDGFGGFAVSPPFELPAEPKIFSDNRVAVTNIGKHNTFHPSDAEQKTFETCRLADIHYALTGHGLTDDAPVEIEQKDLDLYDFRPSSVAIPFGVSPDHHAGGGLFGSHVTLHGFPALGGNALFRSRTVRLESCGQLLGLYSGVSYGWRDVQVTGKRGQDILGRATGTVQFNAYDGASALSTKL